MEAKTIIQMPMFIEVQGDDAFNLIEYSREVAKYQIRGFRNPRIFLFDRRREVNLILGQILETENLSTFADVFCKPAQVIVQRTPDGDLNILLDETNVRVPELMCWIVVGIEGELPQYPYLIQEVNSLASSKKVGMCIYPLEQEKMVEFIELSLTASSSTYVRLE